MLNLMSSWQRAISSISSARCEAANHRQNISNVKRADLPMWTILTWQPYTTWSHLAYTYTLLCLTWSYHSVPKHYQTKLTIRSPVLWQQPREEITCKRNYSMSNLVHLYFWQNNLKGRKKLQSSPIKAHDSFCINFNRRTLYYEKHTSLNSD